MAIQVKTPVFPSCMNIGKKFKRKLFKKRFNPDISDALSFEHLEKTKKKPKRGRS